MTFPDFSYGVTQGETLEEAIDMAQDLLSGLVSDRIDSGQPLPKAARRGGRNYRQVALPALQSAKAELYQAFRASGLRKSELADRLAGVSHEANEKAGICRRVKKIARRSVYTTESPERRHGAENLRQGFAGRVDLFDLYTHARPSLAAGHVD